MKIIGQDSTRTSKAQGMLEFALILPLLLIVVFGVIEIGRLVFIYSAVTTATREAARYGSAAGNVAGVNVPHYADCLGIRQAALRIGSLASINPGDIAISYDHGPSTTVFASSCPPTGKVNLGDRIVIQVRANYVPIVPLVNVRSFQITSIANRTILKDVRIMGTPATAYPTNTPTFTPTPTPTDTATPTPTDTPTNTPTHTPTFTVGPTSTHTPTLTPTLTPTFTPTPTHTFTPSPTPTNTNTPTPTPSPTPACTIYGADLVRVGPKISWELSNTGTTSYTMTSVNLPWVDDPSSQKMNRFVFGAQLWSGNDNNPAFSIGEGPPNEYTWSVANDPNRVLAANSKKTASFEFDLDAKKLSSVLIIVFQNNVTGEYCPVSVPDNGP